jgi:hypothetical protein
MQTINYIIEYDGVVVINNEYTTTLKREKPLIIQWFLNNDLILYTHMPIVLNSANLENARGANIIKINESNYIVRPELKGSTGELRVLGNQQLFVFPKKYTAEVATSSDTSFLTLTDKNDRTAIDLGAVVSEYNIEVNNFKVILTGHNNNAHVLVIFNPKANTVEHKIHCTQINRTAEKLETIEELNTVLGHIRITEFEIHDDTITYRKTVVAANTAYKATDIEVGFAFLQCVQHGDFTGASALLDFPVSPDHLRSYFGDFEILLNNYQNDPRIISIIPKNAKQFACADNVLFEVTNNKITNLKKI